jgi:hypothetical protein
MRRRVTTLTLAVFLTLVMIAAAGCKSIQEKTAASAVAPEAPKACEVRIHNFRGEPFPVLIRRLDAPWHFAFMLQPDNPAMTEEQFLALLKKNPEPKLNYYSLPDLPCGTYRVVAPTLGLAKDFRICDCHKERFNVCFYLLPGDGQEVGL